MLQEHAIEIYARAMWAWFSSEASAEAEKKIRECSQRGDLEGVWWWDSVKFAAIRINDIYPSRRNRCTE